MNKDSLTHLFGKICRLEYKPSKNSRTWKKSSLTVRLCPENWTIYQEYLDEFGWHDVRWIEQP